MYEYVTWKCKEEEGGELPEEMKGWHLLGEAGLDDMTNTTVIGAYFTERTQEKIKKELLQITERKETRKYLGGGRTKEDRKKDVYNSFLMWRKMQHQYGIY